MRGGSFRYWMLAKGLSISSAKKYETALIGSMTDWANENLLFRGQLAEISDPTEFSRLSEKIQMLPIFQKRNSVGKNMYSCALKQFAEYIGAIPVASVEADIDSIIESRTLDTTEKAILIKSRIGQGFFRELLIKFWNKCSVTGVENLDLLLASHIKPWSVSSNKERTDVFNGLLLLPNLDRAFDLGYISFENGGGIIVSDTLRKPDLFGISTAMKFKANIDHKKYLEYHRDAVFRA